VSLCSGIGLALSLGLLLDDVLESLTQTNVEVKRPKYSSRSRDRCIRKKEICYCEKRNVYRKVRRLSILVQNLRAARSSILEQECV
jgi:hypothetical protein